MKSSTSRLLSSTAFVILLGFLADATQGQILNRLHPIKNNNQLIQYSPDDPATRGRLFTLQTGHAGAFYNCDGEECKRQSPWICWKDGPCKDTHRPIWDITQWKRDRAEIAQRICDGGCCCEDENCASQPQSVQAQEACGCSACVAKANSSKQRSEQIEISPSQAKRVAAKAKTGTRAKAKSLIPNANSLVQALNKVGNKSKAKVKASKFDLRSKNQIAGLVTSAQRKPLATQSPNVTSTTAAPATAGRPAIATTLKRTAVAKKLAKPNEVCDCAACRAKRSTISRSAGVASPAPAPKRTASLLERARELQRR